MNRLGAESSPYLRQHADNPVDWYPWGDDAFAEARASDRPVLLSIGYSACHWCHVMAHESFEDPATAEVMNRCFVNIKVDREERPDVDAIYMEATQAMTGRGGWPMTVFLTPDAEPFYCGTYFPKVGRGNQPAFVDVCDAISEAWQDRRDDLLEQAARLTEHVRRPRRLPELRADEPSIGLAGGAASPPAPNRTDPLAEALPAIVAAHDPLHGGFGRAPKFPNSMVVDLTLRAAQRNTGGPAYDVAARSLDAMAAGGIFDHVGGGFARYSVDDRWLVPHFEKMLYDNALLLRPYLHSWQLTGSPLHQYVVERTIAYLLDGPRLDGGAWASAEDADSVDSSGRSVEGAFYVWSVDELQSVLGDGAAEVIDQFGATETGNFEGANILHRRLPPPGAARLDAPDPQVLEALATLRGARASRHPPALDTKALTEWNALVITSVTEAGWAMRRPDWIEAATEAAEFLWLTLRRSDGRWLRSWQAESGPRHLAYAHDLAALVDAFTRLAESTGRLVWLDRAGAVAQQLVDLFWDDTLGGFFTTGVDADALLTRPVDLGDGATPSADSTAASAFQRLAALLSADHPLRSTLLDVATRLLRRYEAAAIGAPLAFAHMLSALDLEFRGVTEVVVVGDHPELLEPLRSAWRPDIVIAWGERGDGSLWDGRSDGHAYICRDHACLAPVTDPRELQQQLDTR